MKPWVKWFSGEKSEKKNVEDNASTNVKVISLFVVDDNAMFAQMVMNYLKLKEKNKEFQVLYNIEMFLNAEECLNNLYKKPDIILLDYYLSPDADGLNGGDVFEKIMQYNPYQKVVMLSGQEESAIVLKLIKTGLRDYIMKDDEMFQNLHQTLIEVYENKKNATWSDIDTSNGFA